MEKKPFSEDRVDKNFTEILLNNVHDGIYFVDLDCKIFFWNKGAEKITGHDLSTVNGKKCSDNIINPVDESGKIFAMMIVLSNRHYPMAKPIKWKPISNTKKDIGYP